MKRNIIEYNIVVKIPPKKVIPVTFIITSIKKGKFRAINNSSEEIRKEQGIIVPSKVPKSKEPNP